MASIVLPSKGRGYQLVLDLSLASQSVATNTSVVNASLYIIKGSGSGAWTSYTCYWSLPNNSGSRAGFDFRSYTTLSLGTSSFTVAHNPDGTGTANASGSFSETDPSPELGNGTVYASLTLPTIPRATQPSVTPTSGNTGSTFTIDHVPAVSTFYHDIAYSLDNGTTYTDIEVGVPGTDTSTDWTPPHSLLPNTTSATAVIRVITYQSSGGTNIGSRTVNLPLTVPASVKPVVSGVSWVDAQTSGPDMPTLMGGAGRFVQAWSRLQPSVTASGAGGSTTVTTRVTQGGQVTSSGVAFNNPVSLSGAVPFTATTTDTRGVVSDPYSNTVAVTAYNFPNLPTPEITRTTDAAGLIPSPIGTYFAITPSASVSDLTFGGSQKNLLEWRIRVKQVGGTYTTVQDWTNATVSGTTWTTKKVIGGGYLASNEYVVEVSIRDLFGKNGFNPSSTVRTLEVLVPSERVEMDWDGKDGMGIGGYRRDPFKLDVHGDIGQNGNSVVDVTDLATTTAKGIVELATSAETSGLSATDLAVTPAGLAALVARLLDASRGRNLIINGNFRTNQRGYVSGASLAAGAYGFDRWKGALGLVNEVQNPTAGTNVAFWTTGPSAGGGIASISGTIPGVSHQGKLFRSTMTASEAYGLYLNGNATSAGAVTVANLPKVEPGKEYTFSLYVKPSVNKTMRISARTLTVAGAILTTNVGPMTALTSGSWTRLSVTFTADATAYGIVVFSEASVVWAAGNTLEYGAAMLTLGSSPVGYFDGATVGGGGWAGVANASPSYRDPATKLTFTITPQGQSVSITGSPLAQIIERTNVPAGDYVLSWSGTAQARVYGAGATPPPFAAAPIAVTLDGLTDVVVEFGAGSAGFVQFEVGSTPTAYRQPSIAEELLACQRYFYAIPTSEGRAQNTYFNVALGFGEIVGEKHPVIMRRVPDVTVVAGSSIYPNALPFDFFAANASGLISKILAGGWSTTTRIKFNYDSGNNGGATLPGGYLTGVNTVPIWVNAEM